MKKLLLESIRCEGGQLQALEWHQRRMVASRFQLFGMQAGIGLDGIEIPDHARQGLFKCRILYGREIEEIEFLPYQIKPVASLRLICADALHYPYKFSDRSSIQQLYNQRGGADDVLFVKNGLLTDTSYANIVLFDGQQWWTPAAPLLPGTRRAALLASGRILPADIRPEELPRFRELRLINAMISLESAISVLPQAIYGSS